MAKKYSLQELKDKGESVAKHHKVKTLLATTDGNFFLEDSKNAAEMHAKLKGLTVHSIEYSVEEATKEKPAKINAEQLIASIKQAESIEHVSSLILGVKTKAVILAAEAKMAELKQAALDADALNGRTDS